MLRTLAKIRRFAKSSSERRRRFPIPLVSGMEVLEDRRLLSLVGIGEPGLPRLDFNSTGVLTYQPSTQRFYVDADALSIQTSNAAVPPDPIYLGDFKIDIVVDSTGNLLGGATGHDLIVSGDVDLGEDFIIDYSGVLLTGEIQQFGWQDNAIPTDRYDFRFTLTSGTMAALYAGSDLGVSVTSENSSFAGSFSVDFGGRAKGVLGAVPKLAQPVSLGDFVWLDANADGIQNDGNTGINGVTVNLLDGSGNVIDTTTTADLGSFPGYYLFDNLTPGTYAVEFVKPAGYVFSPQDQGSDLLDSDANTTTGRTITTTLTSGENDLSWDAGFYKPASLGDFVWDDLNANGIQEAGEPGINGATVNLLNSANSVISTTSTNGVGFYQFTGLTPGVTYKVQFILPTGGYLFSDANVVAATDDTDSDADETSGITGIYILASGQHDPTVDAGVNKPGLGDLARIDIEKYVRPAEMGGGAEGLTPGFWKQTQHFYAWESTGYTQTQSYNAVFGVMDPAGSEFTLLQALGRGGGGYNALGRHAVAGLLNAANPNVDYAYTSAQIIAMVKNAYDTGNFEDTKNLLAYENEKGADLSGGTMVMTPTPGFGYDADEPTGPSVAIGGLVEFTFVVTNMGEVPLANVIVIDNNETVDTTADDFAPSPVYATGTPFNIGDDDKDGQLDVSEVWLYTWSKVVTAGQHTNIGTVVGTPVSGMTPIGPNVTDWDAANWYGGNGMPVGSIDIEKYVKPTDTGSVGGGEGLTPGFWKQSQHFYAWTGYTQGHSYNTVFGVNDPDSPTLLGALQRGGGENKALGRHAVAALLNAANVNVDYAYATAQIIAMVQSAYATGNYENAKNLLASENEKGADLSDGPAVVPPAPGFGDDADLPTGPVVPVGSQVEFTFVVTNPGQVPLSNVVVTDDNATSGHTSDDFNPTPTLDGDFNVGDDNGNNLLDPGEVWLYTALATVTAGQQTNLGAVTGKTSLGGVLTDSDAANYFGQSGSSTSPASITGLVYIDLNNNGEVDAGEAGIPNVVVTLTGTDAFGNLVSITETTDAQGMYGFANLKPSNNNGYAITETTPAGYNDGKDTLGTINNVMVGTAANDVFSSVKIQAGDAAINYTFGELPTATPTTTLGAGMTATIGFWQNKNGQALIKSLNDGKGTALGDWLAGFSNLFGNLAGKDNAFVAGFFRQVFKVTGMKLKAQTLAAALAVYVTDSDLAGGTYAGKYGFIVNGAGTGDAMYNVGSNGTAIGLVNNQSYSVAFLLDRADSWSVFAASSSVQKAFNSIFDGINQAGDIV